MASGEASGASAARGVTLDVVMEVRAIQSIVQMVRAGIGVGFVSRFALRGETGLGEGLACRDGKLGRTLAVVRRRDRTPSPAAGAFERALLGVARDRNQYD
ncbi:MAG: LysR substrate-binding domain-containing protein [Phycisphaerales bacterium JB040]